MILQLQVLRITLHTANCYQIKTEKVDLKNNNKISHNSVLGQIILTTLKSNQIMVKEIIKTRSGITMSKNSEIAFTMVVNSLLLNY